MDGFFKFFRSLIPGSQDEQEMVGSKMVLLRSQFALLAVFLGVLYAIIISVRGEFQFLPWEGILIAGGLLSFYLNRSKKYTLSTITLFLISNLMVYLFTAVSRPQDGMYFYYFITNTVSIILIGNKNYLAIGGLVFITLTLAIAAYLFPSSPVPLPQVSLNAEKMIFLINLVVSILFGSYVIVSLMRENTMVERALIKSYSELRKSNEELDRFVYSASHDMRAPLSSFHGLITIAEMSKTPEETSMCLTMMRERVSVMEGFLDEVTAYSRNVRTGIEKKSVNVLNVVNATLNNLKFLSERSKIDVTVNIPCDATVTTDEPRFKIILNNLISNAIKYFDPAKEKPYITIRTSQSHNLFYLTVEDNGLGIADEHKKRVFDMFYRATTSSEGSGLGLYIVSETVKKLGGVVSFHSEEGKGSAFTLQLPMAHSD